MHLIEKTLLAGPGTECLQVLKSLFLWTDIAHLDYNERILVCRSGGEKHIGVKFPRGAFNTITEVAQKRRCSRTVEAASHGTGSAVSGPHRDTGRRLTISDCQHRQRGRDTLVPCSGSRYRAPDRFRAIPTRGLHFSSCKHTLVRRIQGLEAPTLVLLLIYDDNSPVCQDHLCFHQIIDAQTMQPAQKSKTPEHHHRHADWVSRTIQIMIETKKGRRLAVYATRITTTHNGT